LVIILINPKVLCNFEYFFYRGPIDPGGDSHIDLDNAPTQALWYLANLLRLAREAGPEVYLNRPQVDETFRRWFNEDWFLNLVSSASYNYFE
jgi:hypothetical protein